MTSGFGLQSSNSAKKAHAINDINGTYGLMVYPWTPAIQRCKDQGTTVPAQFSIPVGMPNSKSHWSNPWHFWCVHLHGDELLQFRQTSHILRVTFSVISLDGLPIFAGHWVIFPRKFGWFSPTFHWWPPNFCMACSSEAWGGCSHDSCEESAGRLWCALACIKVLNLWVF